MHTERPYVRVDEHGVMRLGHSRVMLEAMGQNSRKGILPKCFSSSLRC